MDEEGSLCVNKTHISPKDLQEHTNLSFFYRWWEIWVEIQSVLAYGTTSSL